MSAILVQIHIRNISIINKNYTALVRHIYNIFINLFNSSVWESFLKSDSKNEKIYIYCRRFTFTQFTFTDDFQLLTMLTKKSISNVGSFLTITTRKKFELCVTILYLLIKVSRSYSSDDTILKDNNFFGNTIYRVTWHSSISIRFVSRYCVCSYKTNICKRVIYSFCCTSPVCFPHPVSLIL